VHSLALNIARPLEEIALVLVVYLLPQPLAAALVVSRSDGPRTEIERPALIRTGLVHPEHLCGLAVDRTERRRNGREEHRPGRRSALRVALVLLAARAYLRRRDGGKRRIFVVVAVVVAEVDDLGQRRFVCGRRLAEKGRQFRLPRSELFRLGSFCGGGIVGAWTPA